MTDSGWQEQFEPFITAEALADAQALAAQLWTAYQTGKLQVDDAQGGTHRYRSTAALFDDYKRLIGRIRATTGDAWEPE